MSNLNQAELAELSHILDTRARELRADLQREAVEKQDFNDVAPEVPDPADSSFAHLSVDLAHAEATRDIMEFRAVKAARERIEDGSYGECENCGGDIPFERLKAQPTAERCIRCQEMYEKTHVDGLGRTSI